MIDIRQLDPMRRPLDEASHAPGWLYSSPEVYRLEVEQLFMRSWLFVGREEELPGAGDYLTLNYLVARCKDGQWLQLTNDTARLFPMFIAAASWLGLPLLLGDWSMPNSPKRVLVVLGSPLCIPPVSRLAEKSWQPGGT